MGDGWKLSLAISKGISVASNGMKCLSRGAYAKEGACFGLTVLDPRVQGRAAAGGVTVQSQE